MYRPDSVYTERLHKMYRSKDCMEIIERIKDNVTCFYAPFPQKLMTVLTDVNKRTQSCMKISYLS